MTEKRTERPGLIFGLVLAWGLTVLLAIAASIHVVLRFFGDATPFPLDPGSILRLVLGYAVGGITAGLVLDGLLPRARRQREAAVAGFFGAIPFFVAIRIAMQGWTDWAAEEWIRVAMLALVVGVASSRILWRGGSG